jgi:hypothetical protein
MRPTGRTVIISQSSRRLQGKRPGPLPPRLAGASSCPGGGDMMTDTRPGRSTAVLEDLWGHLGANLHDDRGASRLARRRRGGLC